MAPRSPLRNCSNSESMNSCSGPPRRSMNSYSGFMTSCLYALPKLNVRRNAMTPSLGTICIKSSNVPLSSGRGFLSWPSWLVSFGLMRMKRQYRCRSTEMQVTSRFRIVVRFASSTRWSLRCLWLISTRSGRVISSPDPRRTPMALAAVRHVWLGQVTLEAYLLGDVAPECPNRHKLKLNPCKPTGVPQHFESLVRIRVLGGPCELRRSRR